MFDISFSELLLIGVVALIVIGPEKLPKVARTAGHLLGRAQRYVNDVKSDIQREIDADEFKNLKGQVEDAARTVKASVEDASKTFANPLNEARDALKEAADTVNTTAREAQSTVERSAQEVLPDPSTEAHEALQDGAQAVTDSPDNRSAGSSVPSAAKSDTMEAPSSTTPATDADPVPEWHASEPEIPHELIWDASEASPPAVPRAGSVPSQPEKPAAPTETPAASPSADSTESGTGDSNSAAALPARPRPSSETST